jgi:hypothetical protein
MRPAPEVSTTSIAASPARSPSPMIPRSADARTRRRASARSPSARAPPPASSSAPSTRASGCQASARAAGRSDRARASRPPAPPSAAGTPSGAACRGHRPRGRPGSNRRASRCRRLRRSLTGPMTRVLQRLQRRRLRSRSAVRSAQESAPRIRFVFTGKEKFASGMVWARCRLQRLRGPPPGHRSRFPFATLQAVHND